jgi:hypothetical protein
VRVARSALQAAGVRLACSPFCDSWMSELDNMRSRRALGVCYTPLARSIE